MLVHGGNCDGVSDVYIPAAIVDVHIVLEVKIRHGVSNSATDFELHVAKCALKSVNYHIASFGLFQSDTSIKVVDITEENVLAIRKLTQLVLISREMMV